MLAEAALLSGVCAGAAGFWIFALTAFAQRLFLTEPNEAIALAAGACAGILVGASVLWLNRPSMRRTAKRLDALGLKERVITMIERLDSDHVLDELERRDTRDALDALPKRALRVRVPWAAMMLCMLGAMCALGVQFVPVGLMVSKQAAEAAERTEESARIEALMEDMRREIEEANISEADRAALLAMLEEMAGQPDADLRALALMERNAQKMEETLDALRRGGGFLKELARDVHFAPLTKAILDESLDEIHDAVDALEAWLTGVEAEEQRALCAQAVTVLDAAKENMGEDASDAYLVPTFMEMRRGLWIVSIAEMPQADADERVLAALEETEQVICQAILGMFEKNGEADSEGDSTSGVSAEAEQGGEGAGVGLSAGDSYYIGGSEGVSVGSLGLRENEMRERLYEPSLDERKALDLSVPAEEDVCVPYGSVYGRYFAQMLEESSALSEEMRDKVSAYFGEL